jgi:hypothetical protein
VKPTEQMKNVSLKERKNKKLTISEALTKTMGNF